jgi:DNA-binding LytR/AlgR family response regulator
VVRRLKLDGILYAEAMGDYVKLYTPERFYAIHSTLKAVEDRLHSSRFLRIHRSYLVAVDKIDTLDGGALIVGGKPLPVADAFRAALNKRMNIL